MVRTIQHWKTLSTGSSALAKNPAHWRDLFNQAIVALASFNFRPYSLRRGGATWWFARHGSLDKILVQGRRQAPKTARIYLNKGLAIVAELRLPATVPSLKHFLHVFSRSRQLPFTTLEPPSSEGRIVGRGKGKLKRKNGRKILFV